MLAKEQNGKVNLEDYTSDSICRAMGLRRFVESSWLQPKISALRVVLTPSFDNEVCLTLVEEAGDVHLEVRALDQKFWAEGAPRAVLPYHSNACRFGYGLFQEAATLFSEARDEAKKKRAVCLDGMGMDACFAIGGEAQNFEINTARGGAPAELTRKLIDWSWTMLEDPYVRNALARCAAYVEREYSLKKVPSEKPITRSAETRENRSPVLAEEGQSSPAVR